MLEQRRGDVLELFSNKKTTAMRAPLIPPDHKRPRARRGFYEIERRIAAHAREVVAFAGGGADEEQPRRERKGGLNG